VRVRVKYFASFRDMTGKTEESLEVPEGITVEGLREHIKGLYVKMARREQVLVAIEVYEEMAVKQLSMIRDEALERFGVHEVAVVHRYGDLEVGDNIVYIGVSAGHREEAFQACRYVIDELKERVPLWKKEYTADGEVWVEGDRRE